MKTYKELETAYLALCDTVVRDTLNIVGYAGNGRAQDAGRAAVNLMDIAADAKEQYIMEQEQGTYDLNALKVNPSVPSNSETGWENSRD